MMLNAAALLLRRSVAALLHGFTTSHGAPAANTAPYEKHTPHVCPPSWGRARTRELAWGHVGRVG